MDLNGKVALVTGASSGIGLAIARAFLGRGARVVGMARSADRLEALRAELGERFVPAAGDVAQEPDVARVFDALRREAGRLDVLVNNAGLGRFAPIDRLALEDWDVQMATNLRGVFLCTRAAVPMMKQQNAETGFGGHIVNIASIAGLMGNPNLGAYNATKFGLRGLSEALMKELRDDGIKVTCVYPGSVDTNFGAVAGTSGSPQAMLPDEIADTVRHVVETRDNYLISEVVMRPLRPKG